MKLSELIEHLQHLQANVGGEVEVCVGTTRYPEPVAAVKEFLHEPRDASGKRLTSVRKIIVE